MDASETDKIFYVQSVYLNSPKPILEAFGAATCSVSSNNKNDPKNGPRSVVNVFSVVQFRMEGFWITFRQDLVCYSKVQEEPGEEADQEGIVGSGESSAHQLWQSMQSSVGKQNMV
ncbi:hypothetical protein M514_23126 [Trichuris suis]|uniref:Uncharacterized protein n=1 Tax=Trichuris suis TaxID=68888 RepID=A0A085N5C2_9BILA|nr:hypothetical protein M514_23126 [Trichuris suis]